jgi:DNA-binding transcriptional LysR family regulator
VTVRHLLPLKYIDAVARTRSFRAAAEAISITPSALNRRIIAIEEELGVELFERTSKGVRLNSAGELFVQHIRTQIADLERVKSRIADLKGLRLGHVRIATTPEFARNFLPTEIQKYRKQFPGVSFEVHVSNRNNVENALSDQTSDLAIVLQPNKSGEFHSLGLMECLEYDLLLPAPGNGIRDILEEATAAKRLLITPAVESNNLTLLEQIASKGDGLGFTIPIDMNYASSSLPLRYVPIDTTDVPLAHLFLGQLRFRTLPVAAAKFVEDIRVALQI